MFRRRSISGTLSTEKQRWSSPYYTLEDAKRNAETIADVLEARSKGLTVVELGEVRNANRLPIETAVELFHVRRNKARKTVMAYTSALSEFVDPRAYASWMNLKSEQGNC